MLPAAGDPPSEQGSRQEPRGGPSFWPVCRRNRLLLSVAVGLAITVIAVLASWLEYRRDFWYRDPQATTQTMLDTLHESIIRYRKEKQHWPSTLDDVDPVTTRRLPMSPPWLDAWGHPMIYEFHGEQPLVMSLGSDGRPGGTGYDHDLIGGDPVPPAATATLADFLFQQPSLVMIETCLLTGGFASLLTLYLMRFARTTPVAVTQLVLCTGFAIGAAVIMSAAHIPTQVYPH
jgi:hypothetical protein